MKSLDWLIAEHITELEYDIEAGYPVFYDVPHYSTDLAAAWQIDKPGWRWEFSELSCGLDVILWSESGDLEKLGQAYILWDSVPDKATAYCLARCRAALEAVGVDWEAENDL